MKTEQRQQAQTLFFQTNHTKTQIADMLSVSRRTISKWAHEGNWNQLRKSSRTLPAIVAEKCYHMVDEYASGILADRYTAQNINIRHAQTIHLLASSIKKLKAGSTVNETMQTFNLFLGGLQLRHPELATQVAPEVDEFIRLAAASTSIDHMSSAFAPDGTIPFPAMEIEEQYKDEKDAEELNREFDAFLAHREATGTTPPSPPGSEPPGGQNAPEEALTPPAPPHYDGILHDPHATSAHEPATHQPTAQEPYYGSEYPSEEAFITSIVSELSYISEEDRQQLILDARLRDQEKEVHPDADYFFARLTEEGILPRHDDAPLDAATLERVRQIRIEVQEKFPGYPSLKNTNPTQ